MAALNIWVAASDGKLERVQASDLFHLSHFCLKPAQELLDQGTDPNGKDANSYTPMHAASSWSHPDILRLLVSRGGDVNVTDDDGETPVRLEMAPDLAWLTSKQLFVAETPAMAELLIQLGADPQHKSNQGLTATQHLAEDSPDVARYLSTVTGESVELPNQDDAVLDQRAEMMSRNLMDEVARMNPEEVTEDSIRQIVAQAVQNAAESGQAMGEESRTQGDDANKRRRQDQPQR